MQLTKFDALIDVSISCVPNAHEITGTVIIGKSSVYLNGFNSSADCSVVSYFVSDYKILASWYNPLSQSVNKRNQADWLKAASTSLHQLKVVWCCGR